MDIKFAEYIAYWKGDYVAVCESHLLQLVTVANAIKFNLQYQPIPWDDVFCTNCANQKKRIPFQAETGK